MPNRLVFMGSPEFALPILRSLHDHHNVTGVVTQPDRPAGRGRTLHPPPIKTLALELGIPIDQPERLSAPQALARLKSWQPDLIIVAAYGQILRPDVLALPARGCLNVHASLLPRWRGASPIQAAILHGDTETGITIMQMDPGMDTGPILSQRSLTIQSDDTTGSLSPRLSQMGADLLLETLPMYLSGELLPTPQDDSLATPAPILKKSDGRLDFTRPANDLERQVRAFSPWPGAFINWSGKILKIHSAWVASDVAASPGETLIHAGFPAVGTPAGIIIIEKLQPEGKKLIDGNTFLNGARQWGKIPVQDRTSP